MPRRNGVAAARHVHHREHRPPIHDRTGRHHGLAVGQPRRDAVARTRTGAGHKTAAGKFRRNRFLGLIQNLVRLRNSGKDSRNRSRHFDRPRGIACNRFGDRQRRIDTDIEQRQQFCELGKLRIIFGQRIEQIGCRTADRRHRRQCGV